MLWLEREMSGMRTGPIERGDGGCALRYGDRRDTRPAGHVEQVASTGAAQSSEEPRGAPVVGLLRPGFEWRGLPPEFVGNTPKVVHGILLARVDCQRFCGLIALPATTPQQLG
jgi:hypothetical protein